MVTGEVEGPGSGEVEDDEGEGEAEGEGSVWCFKRCCKVSKVTKGKSTATTKKVVDG